MSLSASQMLEQWCVWIKICVRSGGEEEIHQICQERSGRQSPVETEGTLLLMRQIYLLYPVWPPDLHSLCGNNESWVTVECGVMGKTSTRLGWVSILLFKSPEPNEPILGEISGSLSWSLCTHFGVRMSAFSIAATGKISVLAKG